MRRRSATRNVRPMAATQEPLEERVDKAGKRLLAQRNAKRKAAERHLARATEAAKAKPKP